MKLPIAEPPSRLKQIIQRVGQAVRLSSPGLLGLIIILSGLGAFWLGALATSFEMVNPVEVQASVGNLRARTVNYLSALTSPPPAHVVIDIKHRDFQWLAYRRQIALNLGKLVASGDDFVPANIQFEGETLPVKVRLKGDMVDHLETNKWSLRVRVKDDQTIMGMRVFSLQHPETRNFLSEWLYHQALAREDVLSLRYDFVQVTINGRNTGVYALEEHFDKRLIERNRRKEGPIIRFSENGLWERFDEWETFVGLQGASGAGFLATPIDAFQSGSISEDSLSMQLFLKAASLLDGFRSGEYWAHEVFDIEKLARYLAVSELVGAQHGALWKHMRFYYNPISARLEPIGFDGNSGQKISRLWGANLDPKDTPEQWAGFQVVAFRDSVFKAAYFKQVHRMSKPEYLQALLDDTAEERDRMLRILHRDFPGYAFSDEKIWQNQRLMRLIMNPMEGVRAHLSARTQRTLTIDIGSTQPVPVEVLGISWCDTSEVAIEKEILPARRSGQPIRFTRYTVESTDGNVPVDSLLQNLSVKFRLMGTDEARYGLVNMVPRTSSTWITSDLSRKPANVDQFPFLRVDDVDSTVQVPEGAWTLQRPLIVPRGYTLSLAPGASLDLQDSSVVVAHGPVSMIGTAAAPIRFFSSDGTGRGLAVLHAASESVIAHTSVDGLASVNDPAWSLTGGITFYESPVRITNTHISNNSSEDALNIVRATFVMEDVVFTDIYADAFDADFTEGTISRVRFERIGNDGVDVSGSQVQLVDVEILNAGDKGLSVGEYSEVEASGLVIQGGEIAVASKDNSILKISHSQIRDARIGLAIFQKKSEFGPAFVETNQLTLSGAEHAFLLEAGSQLLLEGALQDATHENVDELLYGTVYGSASR